MTTAKTIRFGVTSRILHTLRKNLQMHLPLKVLYLGESWQGSNARSMREAMAGVCGVTLADISEDHYNPRWSKRWMRGVSWLLGAGIREELSRVLKSHATAQKPDVLIVYKGWHFMPEALAFIKSQGILTVNIFPDYSPVVYGRRMAKIVGMYDLVISTKPFHPGTWNSSYGYDNKCLCVPAGYDPIVHCRTTPSDRHDVDVLLAATWRQEYEDIIREVSLKLKFDGVSMRVLGNGWPTRLSQEIQNCEFLTASNGHSYTDSLRKARIVVAPLQPTRHLGRRLIEGDVDTSRTYELAAAFCFFLHKRNPYVASIYSEESEVPMWNDTEELVKQIRRYLRDEHTRQRMATAAHAKAVPEFSLPSRATQIIDLVRKELRATRNVQDY